MIAIVLVGGKYATLSDSYPELPLALVPVAGQPIVYWLTQWLKQQGVNHIVFSAGYGADKITAWAHQMTSQQKDLFIDVLAESRPLGTAGAVAVCAKRYPASHYLVTNGNSLLPVNLKPALQQLKKSNSDGIILGTRIANAGRFGSLECNAQKQLTAFYEKQSGKGLVNAGIYLLKNHLLNDINPDKESSLEYEWFPKWLSAGKHFLLTETSAPFIDLGTTEAIKQANDLIDHYQEEITGESLAAVS